MRTKDDWDRRTRNLLKGELARRGLSYEDLSIRLKKIGVNQNANNIRSKINRGTFSATFMIQVLKALGCKSLDLNVD
ncbi:MAG TPA: DUF6471 domain-containing protein [Acidiferrobacterales bacterium]|nr:DUF6471 domain-containing protein [Acidiferrobacterales bacterium]